jgi:hypothetical protein
VEPLDVVCSASARMQAVTRSRSAAA